MKLREKIDSSRARQRATIGALSALALSACTSYAPHGLAPGTPRAEVLQRMGAPSATHEVSSTANAGSPLRRLEYARGPMGKHTYFLDFDKDDRLLRWEQVLTEQRFHQVRAGMTSTEVRALLGTPSQVWELPLQAQQVWSYRFVGPFCRWFMVGVSRDRRVADTSFGPDPQCEPLMDD